jgi:hypothetical protein
VTSELDQARYEEASVGDADDGGRSFGQALPTPASLITMIDDLVPEVRRLDPIATMLLLLAKAELREMQAQADGQIVRVVSVQAS